MLGAQIIGEMYIPLGSNDVDPVIQAIKKNRPEVVFNTIDGITNKIFFERMRAEDLAPEQITTISFNIAEPELSVMGTTAMAGDYAVLNYFQSINRPENSRFISAFQNRFGQRRVISNTMESAYDNVYLWAQAVEAAHTTDVAAVLQSLKNQVFDGPGSIIYLDEHNQAWREIFVGRIRYDNQFDIVWRSKKSIRPVAYPHYQDKASWDLFLKKLYEEWGNQWTHTA